MLYEILQALKELEQFTGYRFELHIQSDDTMGHVTLLTKHAECHYDGLDGFNFTITPEGTDFMEVLKEYRANYAAEPEDED